MYKFFGSAIEQGEVMKNICPWRINYTNERTYHYFLCKRCFEEQEFHETFINNCVIFSYKKYLC